MQSDGIGIEAAKSAQIKHFKLCRDGLIFELDYNTAGRGRSTKYPVFAWSLKSDGEFDGLNARRPKGI
jgi:hypothetical protein